MGKRGPKRGCGGRPIKFNDEYHKIMREIRRQYVARLREVQSQNVNACRKRKTKANTSKILCVATAKGSNIAT